MNKYYKADDVLAIFSEEERPLNWTDSEAEIQAESDFDFYKSQIESLPTIEVADLSEEAYEVGYTNGQMAERKRKIEVSEDCISREELLKDFGLSEKSRKYGGDHSGYQTLMLYEIQDIIEDAPSVVVRNNRTTTEQSSKVGERKRGEWSITNTYRDRTGCVVDRVEHRKENDGCGYVWGREMGEQLHNYCPHCGAKMKGANDAL